MASNSSNKWRLLQHAGDGDAIYQCLKFHQLWESPTAPGWIDVTGQYQREWRFCPYCGAEWEGPATNTQEALLHA